MTVYSYILLSECFPNCSTPYPSAFNPNNCYNGKTVSNNDTIMGIHARLLMQTISMLLVMLQNLVGVLINGLIHMRGTYRTFITMSTIIASV